MNVGIPTQPEAVEGLRDKALRSIRTRGMAGTLRLSLALLRETWRRNLTWNPYNPLGQFLDRRYDARFGVDTAGIDLIHELESDTVNAYSPVPRWTLRRMLRRLPIHYSDFAFVDLGCGKGKALLVAAEVPFREIVGVEVAPRLAAIARENLRKFARKNRVPQCEVVLIDAREFRLSEKPLVIFFYDPFTAEVMEPVLDGIRRSLQRAPRPIYILYAKPRLRNLMDDCGFLSLVRATSAYCIYEAAPSRER